MGSGGFEPPCDVISDVTVGFRSTYLQDDVMLRRRVRAEVNAWRKSTPPEPETGCDVIKPEIMLVIPPLILLCPTEIAWKEISAAIPIFIDIYVSTRLSRLFLRIMLKTLEKQLVQVFTFKEFLWKENLLRFGMRWRVYQYTSFSIFIEAYVFAKL